jgi:hypothetical protein
MKKTKYQLTITNPCQQNWEDMKKQPDGNFCMNCSKSVIDFTAMSDNEIRKYMENNQGKVCGRLLSSQVNRFLEYKEPSKRSCFYPLLSGLLFIQSNDILAAHLSGKNEFTTITTPQKNIPKNKEEKEHTIDNQPKNIIKGQITDEKFFPMPGAIIFLKGSNTRTTADKDGKFSLSIPDTHLPETKVLEVTYLNFEKQQIVLTKKDYNNEIKIKMKKVESCIEILGEIIMITPQSKSKKKKS